MTGAGLGFGFGLGSGHGGGGGGGGAGVRERAAGLSRKDLRRTSPSAPRRHAIALSAAVGAGAIAWSLLTLGTPFASSASRSSRLFSLHAPLMAAAVFVLLPLSARLVSTAGRGAHVALNAAAALLLGGGAACAALAHAADGSPHLHSAHSWVAAGALALVAAAAFAAAVLGARDTHRAVARTALGALFAAAALGFAAVQADLAAEGEGGGHNNKGGAARKWFGAGAVGAGVLAVLSLVCGAVVLSGDDATLRRAMSVRTDVTVPISEGGSSSENDIVLYELDEQQKAGSGGSGGGGGGGGGSSSGESESIAAAAAGFTGAGGKQGAGAGAGADADAGADASPGAGAGVGVGTMAVSSAAAAANATGIAAGAACVAVTIEAAAHGVSGSARARSDGEEGHDAAAAAEDGEEEEEGDEDDAEAGDAEEAGRGGAKQRGSGFSAGVAERVLALLAREGVDLGAPGAVGDGLGRAHGAHAAVATAV